VLELGAGTGNAVIPVLAAGRRVTAVELSRAMLEKFRSKLLAEGAPQLTVIEQNAEHLPQLTDSSFDGVSILLALYDMAKPDAAFGEALRLLRPGGTLIITEPKHCFNLKVLVDAGSRFLREQGLMETLEADWNRVHRANRLLDPATRSTHSPLRAEIIHQQLASKGFRELTIRDSHLGHCATVQGRKPQT